MTTRLPILVGLLVLGLAFPGPSAEAADPSDPDWPCIQRKIPEVSAGMMWAGPALPEDEKAWQADQDLSAEVALLALRRLSIEEAQARIDAWSTALAADKNRKLTLLFAGLLQTINAERSEIIDGIERYTRRQRALADKVRAMRATIAERQTAEHQAAKQQAGEAQSSAEIAETQSLEEALAWEVRIFQEREESLSYVCESPVILEQRLFALARHIMTHLED